MITLEEIKDIIRAHKETLRQKYKVKELAIFGSYVRGEQGEISDIDILVEFEEPIGLEFFSLEEYLENLLGLKVDLVSKKGVKPNRWKYIQQDLVYV